jgi:hypothetical protein
MHPEPAVNTMTNDMVERVARHLQRRDFSFDCEQADLIWNDDLEQDAYKNAYRIEAEELLYIAGVKS